MALRPILEFFSSEDYSSTNREGGRTKALKTIYKETFKTEMPWVRLELGIKTNAIMDISVRSEVPKTY